MRSARGRADRRVHGLFTVLVAACLVPALSGCVLVGDSVSAFMTAQLRTVVPIVDADFGRSLDQHGWQTQESGAQAVRRWEGLHPPWIIIQVGANDVNATGDANVWRTSIRNTLASVPSTQCVGWVLVYDVRQPARSDQFNAVVEQEVASGASQARVRALARRGQAWGHAGRRRAPVHVGQGHAHPPRRRGRVHVRPPRLPLSATSALVDNRASGTYPERGHGLVAVPVLPSSRHRGCAVRFAGSRPRVPCSRRSSGRE